MEKLVVLYTISRISPKFICSICTNWTGNLQKFLPMLKFFIRNHSGRLSCVEAKQATLTKKLHVYLVSKEVGKRVSVGSLGNAVESKQMAVHSESSHRLHLVTTLQTERRDGKGL